MVQYEMYFTNEYIEDVINDLAVIMELNVEKKVIDAAMQERDKTRVVVGEMKKYSKSFYLPLLNGKERELP